MTDYRVRPRKWQDRDADGIGVLWVSLSKDDTKGDKLRSAAGWMDAHFSRGWYIDLADTLDRHNRTALYGTPPDQAELEARKAGQDWIAGQQPNLHSARNLKGIITFDHWRTHRDFEPTLEQLRNLLDISQPYETAVRRDASEFVTRRFSGSMSEERRRDLLVSGTNYVLEETAAGILAARELRATRFYPGPQLSSLQLLRAGNVPHAPEGYDAERYVEFNLERRGPSPQQNNIPIIGARLKPDDSKLG